MSQSKNFLKCELEKVLKLVIDWIKFAEAKNAALLTLNSAAMFAGYRIVFQIKRELSTIESSCLLFLAILLLISAVICLMSFFARIKTRYLYSIPAKSKSPNLYFFGDIASFSSKDYVAALAKTINENEIAKELDMMLADQVIANSRIAARKFRLFNIALWFSLSAFLTPVGSLLVWFLNSEE